ncbi:A4/G1 family peptidase [Aspergillus clavatus NRRL 1]|uniref:Aspergillopepsin, putative n=1 Tax=Aspergillus clavatus (strain ATCC 1007 / CBS 513.65 / DSM 816 / NCTC 3887 / NRRL 1 / QM 1276 / 107) TaxID=344612 RepID=A1CCC7_ASPCL|nr:aspergillopepsin, putative [Aspergillus clavatus NRRL 1]EAW12184.1 aspergillopepsin, putative [Aspergillus clavatus NRRL 1]
MKFSAVVASSLLAGAAIAAPLTEQRQARHARRTARATNRSSHPPYKVGSSELLELSNSTHVEYSSNWAGAVLIGNGYTSVVGEFTVPEPSAPDGADSGTQYCASAWVGIDGDTCSSAILQTGVDFCIQDGSVSFDAWYEWYPDYAYDFSGIDISVGDTIKLTIDATSKTAGSAIIQNLSTGKTVKHTFTGGVDGDLCETNAEWIVEDFESNGSLVPFVNFGTVTFTGAKATTGGSSVGPSGATLMDIKQGSSVLTSSSVSGNSVSVSYV